MRYFMTRRPFAPSTSATAARCVMLFLGRARSVSYANARRWKTEMPDHRVWLLLNHHTITIIHLSKACVGFLSRPLCTFCLLLHVPSCRPCCGTVVRPRRLGRAGRLACRGPSAVACGKSMTTVLIVSLLRLLEVEMMRFAPLVAVSLSGPRLRLAAPRSALRRPHLSGSESFAGLGSTGSKRRRGARPCEPSCARATHHPSSLSASGQSDTMASSSPSWKDSSSGSLAE